MAIVPQGIHGSAAIVPRVAGIAAGVDLIEAILQELDANIEWTEIEVSGWSTFRPDAIKLGKDTFLLQSAACPFATRNRNRPVILIAREIKPGTQKPQ